MSESPQVTQQGSYSHQVLEEAADLTVGPLSGPDCQEKVGNVTWSNVIVS